MDTRIGVYLLAENRLLREALTRVLNKRAGIAVLGAEPHSVQAASLLTRARADILLSDLFPSVAVDARAIRRWGRLRPELKTILIGMPDDEGAFLHAVRAGAMGYVLNEASALEVLSAVRAVAQGEAVCPPRFSSTLFRYVARQATDTPNVRVRLRLGLTRREQQLIPMIAEGLTNKEIAAALNLSEQTVKNHIHRMLRKAGASDRLSVVELCRTEGFYV